MNSLVRNMRVIPSPLLGMFLIFLVVPFLSLAIHRPPWELVASDGWYRAILVGLAYWVCPWMLCFAIVYRRFLFLPFYLVQCGALALHSWSYGKGVPFDLEITRYVLIACMGYIGVLFANKDFLYPFLAKNPRFWRKARRFELEWNVTILGDSPKETVDGTMTNCSVTGLGVRVPQSNFKQFLRRKRRGARLSFQVKKGPLEWTIPAEVVWLYDYGPYGNLGLRVMNTDRMIEFVAAVTGEKDADMMPLRSRHAQLLEHDVRQTAFVLWMLFIALSFSIPAFAAYI